MTHGSNELHFFYDAQNKPAIVVYNGTPYSYVKNLQGDIVAILDANGVVVVSYVYDAWGRPISKAGSMASTLGTVQPFRYRGYIYDEETELYYLRSRYYTPTMTRFVNVDFEIHTEAQLFGAQLYSYCANNPIKNIDSEGTWFWDAVKEAATAIAVVAAVVAVVAVVVAVTAGTGGTGLVFASGGIMSGAASAWSVAGAAACTSIGASVTAGVIAFSQHGIGGHGWRGDRDWRDNVRRVGEGGDQTSLKGGVPTENEAIDLINEANGSYVRTDSAHLPTHSTHIYDHVHYLTERGIKGVIRIIEVLVK